MKDFKAKSRKILIGGYDFEEKIHRGISFWGRSLVKALSKDNTTYLLTSAKYFKEPIVFYKSVIEQLMDPYHLPPKKKIIQYIKSLFLKKRPKILNLNTEQKRNIILVDRLRYLNYISNFYNVEYFYDITSVHNRFFLKKPFNIKLKDIDIFITTSPMNIKSNVPLIQTLHDVLPLTSPYHPPDDDKRIFYYRVLNMLKYSTIIISVSKYSRDRCLEIFPNFEEKIKVIYQPAPIYDEEKEIINNPLVKEAILKGFKLEEQNYLFYVGTLEKRKNIKGLINAFLAIYNKIKIPLVLAGSLGYGNEEFKHYLKRYKHIKYIGYISNIEKLVLIKNARAFLFPSFEEGFGIPPLEALSLGTPVLTSNTSSLPEVCGNAALYINPYSIKDIATGILEITLNESLRERIVRNGFQQIKKFSFENFEKQLSKIISSI